jgi:peptide/nickel transport system ATP-binding protein
LAETPLLDIRGLSVAFATRAGEVPAVTDFSCAVMRGEAMGLVGESGCGKSTVALAILRDLGRAGRITAGRILFDGEDVATMSASRLRALRGGRVAMVYQEPMASLNPAMRIGAQLAEAPMIHDGVDRAEARARALAMLRAVRLPDPERVMGAYPHQLSGGQQQRVVIAMALLCRPELLLMDEPTTALDVTVEAGIVDLVKDLAAETGAALLFISHNLGLVLEVCRRVTVMYAGQAVETGPVGDVFRDMRHPYTQGLFRSIPVPGADKTRRPLVAIPGQLPLPQDRPEGCVFGPRCAHFAPGLCDAGPVPMVPAGEGRLSRCLRIDAVDWAARPPAGAAVAPVEPGGTVLSVEGLRKYYDVAGGSLLSRDTRTVKANESLDIEAREAETVAIVGESGCGKSTLAKVLLGLETATEGAVKLGAIEIGDKPVAARGPETVSRIQMVFQNPFDTLNPSQTVGRQIMRVLKLFRVGATEADRRARMYELLDTVKLPRAFAARKPRQLSGGQKQRVGIARAFAGEPDVVVADEPVSALDVSVQAAVTGLLTEIQRDRRTTLLFISHDLGVVRYLADRVVVMYLGRVVEQGTTAQVYGPPYHPYTEALLSAAPIADADATRQRIVLEGETPSALDPPPGCPFQTRCHRKADAQAAAGRPICETEAPDLREMGDGHRIRCWLPEKTLRAMVPVVATAAA